MASACNWVSSWVCGGSHCRGRRFPSSFSSDSGWFRGSWYRGSMTGINRNTRCGRKGTNPQQQKADLMLPDFKVNCWIDSRFARKVWWLKSPISLWIWRSIASVCQCFHCWKITTSRGCRKWVKWADNCSKIILCNSLGWPRDQDGSSHPTEIWTRLIPCQEMLLFIIFTPILELFNHWIAHSIALNELILMIYLSRLQHW